ncbi:23S rRNA (pseudouridine(1915)-N(3))-methyltransferase RlmH [Thermanaeromonas sp. C210]|uniref:23S rRNA (pseudouridine(1915)-N(3))-methyltransferase RlmH n=1 Tax=Thermanaeromonas sp. C210 TaxID=2731925 RepID=UPI0015632F87|nr:23S rRNA (pseudouridine(1915)-N(3))-methyltransferase RlmH [Thermanaeromonas sp. C210]
MEIYVVAVGRVKEKYLQEGIKEYSKRLRPYVRLEIREGTEEKVPGNLTPGQEERILALEGQSLLRLLPDGAYIIALDREGEMLSSEELAEHLADLALQGRSQVAFVIGGTLGLSQEVLDRAHFKLSFSPLTFPHQLMRLILLEQLYRACKIRRGEPYHR